MNSKYSAADTEVVIAGLGPTGLILAHMLGMRGHQVTVLEKEPAFYGNARAVYTDDECMRIFQHINCAAEVGKDVLSDVPAQFVRTDCTVMGQYLPRKRPFGWPVVNFFYQPYLETTLTDALSRYPNVTVLRGREVVDFRQDSDGVTITHQATQVFRFDDAGDRKMTSDGVTDYQDIRALFLVGCDGGRSLVREKLGIKMTGKSFPEPWLVVDLEKKPGCDELRHMPYFNFVVDPGQPVVSCIQPDAFHRFEFMLKPGQTKEYMEHPDTVRRLISRYVDPDKFEVKRKLVYTFNALIVEKWQVGRVLLGGDAAHMTPQFMGQGASAGIRDGYNLGWKLSAVLKGQASESLLETYGKERHDHAKAMIDISVQLKDMVSMTNPLLTTLRDISIKAILAIKPLREYVQEGEFKPKPSYTNNCFLGLKRRGRKSPEGTLAPQPEVRLINGQKALLDDVCGNSFSLIGLDTDPRDALSESNLAWLASLNTRYLSVVDFGQRPQGLHINHATVKGLTEVEDMNGLMTQWLRKANRGKYAVAILRPDRFAFSVVSADNLNAAVSELKKQMGQGQAKIISQPAISGSAAAV
ncbi:bifunctional 3-(3-hydroxy-phenyl)propionate/3-hydroxycinnamic acid hydroxylase [Thalassolituus sp. LLYu03]|uniref:bifunctional 3-(3-hydroxy-phenyl)propionate/3-hydroxycinnamic acid hydroxylase MhpA n=1 Tax=Thalassolituus sp. LLYu03 TaxID=3421656 RepID=UPI003D269FC3